MRCFSSLASAAIAGCLAVACPAAAAPDQPHVFQLEMHGPAGAAQQAGLSDLEWHGPSPDADADGLAWDGSTWASYRAGDLGDVVAIDLRCRIHAVAPEIGGTILAGVHHERPRQIVWALRTRGDSIEVVRLEERDGEEPRYRSLLSRDPIEVGKPVDVRVRLTPYEMSLTVDGTPRWTTRSFGSVPADTLVIGGEGEGGGEARRFRGEIQSLAVETRRFPQITTATHDGRPVALVELPAADDAFVDAPRLLEVPMRRLREIWPEAREVDVERRLRVYRWEKARNAIQGAALPIRVEADPQTGRATIGCLAGNGDAGTLALVLGPAAEPGAGSAPVEIPLIGAGEPVSVGRSDLSADAGQLLASYPAVVDWDLDGDKDLLVAGVIPRRVVLFENIADRGDSVPVLAAPRPIYGGMSFLTFDLWQLPDGRIQILQAAKGKQALELWRDGIEGGERTIERVSTMELRGLPEGAGIADVHLTDLDDDGLPDLVLSVTEGDWWWEGSNPWNNGLGHAEIGYGRGYDETGRWFGKPPIGSFWVARNRGDAEEPRFDALRVVTAEGEPIRVPTTQLAATLLDFDGDGDRELLAAVDVDRLLVFEKTTRDPWDLDFRLPRNALRETPVSKWSYFDSRFEQVDWEGDGKLDLLMGSNPGLIVLARITPDGLVEESVLQSRGAHVWAETLVVPTITDMDGDGAWDILMGDASGFLNLFRNSGSRTRPVFAAREKMRAGDELFRPVAGYSGSIQGPNEARWGYLAPAVGDWDGDGVSDVVLSDITGYVYWLRNAAGPNEPPRLQAREPIEVGTWPLKVRWRTRPALVVGESGSLPRLVMTDEEGYLSLYERDPMQGPSNVRAGERMLLEDGNPIKLDGPSGYNGRTKLFATDWDRDGVWDLLVGQPARAAILPDTEFSLPRHRKATVAFLRNVGTAQRPRFAAAELLTLADGAPLEFGNHSCAPSVYDVDGDGWDDLFVGAETGFVHYFHRSMFEDASRIIRIR